MNVKELMQLLELVKDVIDTEETNVCIDDLRDGSNSFVKARIRFTYDEEGGTILAVSYE